MHKCLNQRPLGSAAATSTAEELELFSSILVRDSRRRVNKRELIVPFMQG